MFILSCSSEKGEAYECLRNTYGGSYHRYISSRSNQACCLEQRQQQKIVAHSFP